jgi:hypothetical protein
MAGSSATVYSPGDEWRRALAVADAVRQLCQGLRLEPGSEWLRQVMTESADQMRAAVLWAASQRVPEDKSRGGLRNLIVAADATRSDAALASYFLNFLHSEHLVEREDAEMVGARLQEVESGMDLLSRRLCEDLGFDPYEAS